MPLTLSQRPETAAKFLWTEHLWTHSLLRRTGVVGDVAPLEETVETDSERGAMASRGRRGGVPARDDEQRREERVEQ
ncbi:hypothetical protein Taro_005431 [Colocasia esculenta]|uniref:Uncharacterized protein n=1 Tax=Colocasia esculenta TaxID=4460 RepID=A0A843TN26_COLES|nr:hypothetical protein [Colocasia esculenta]